MDWGSWFGIWSLWGVLGPLTFRALGGPLSPESALNSWRQGGKAEAGHTGLQGPPKPARSPRWGALPSRGGVGGVLQRCLLTSRSDCEKRRRLIAKEYHMAPLGRHMVNRWGWGTRDVGSVDLTPRGRVDGGSLWHPVSFASPCVGMSSQPSRGTAWGILHIRPWNSDEPGLPLHGSAAVRPDFGVAAVPSGVN